MKQPRPLKSRTRNIDNHDSREQHDVSTSFDETVSGDIVEVEQRLRLVFTHSSDVVFRRTEIVPGVSFLTVYIDSLVDESLLERSVMQPLLAWGLDPTRPSEFGWKSLITKKWLPAGTVKSVVMIRDVVYGVLQANVAVILSGEDVALLAAVPGWPERSIEESPSESGIRGPRDAFTESVRTNIALVRKRLKNPHLNVELMSIGTLSNTDVALIYLEGIVNERVLQEVRTRLDAMEVDAVLDSHYIEEFIEDSPLSPYPQIQDTERPDVVVAGLLEGKVSLLVDGTPFALVLPMTFWAGFQAPDDYYQRPLYVTAVRWVRFVMLNLSIFLTPLYVSLVSFDPQMVPTDLLMTFAAARDGVPFPTVVEAFMMEFLFEGLREAGVRLPRSVGSAVSIVGALVIGQAAVNAGLVSAPTVIVVAASGIASFTIPRYSLGLSYRLLRFLMLFMAGTAGLYGITVVFLLILIHQVNLESFGVPYLSPLAPQNFRELRDVLIRLPRWVMKNRPATLTGKGTRMRASKRNMGNEP